MHFDAGEVDALRALVEQLRDLLTGREASASDNEVLERLFPPAYDSAAEDKAYRELVGDALREEKEANLRVVSEGLERAGEGFVTLRREEVDAWLAVLTDMRLAIGTRLEVTEETMAETEPRGPEAPAFRVLHWLGWLQESILKQIDAGEEHGTTEAR